jgi:hypothetical protein
LPSTGGDPTRIAEVAEAFIAAFPDIEVVMDDLVLRDDGSVEYRWTFTGTSAETGVSVRVPGYEEWTIAPNGLIAESRGHYDQAEYERQLQHGVSAAPLGPTQASFPNAGAVRSDVASPVARG